MKIKQDMNKKRGAVAGAVLIAVLALVLNVLPSAAQTSPPPIASEFLTGRAVFTDNVDTKFKIKMDGTRGWRACRENGKIACPKTVVVKDKDPSRAVVGRFTVQPGAQFPWHTHRGPVVVNVVQGELTYLPSDDCVERKYAAGTAFVDPGHGHAHTARNATGGVTVFVATFFSAPAQGPLLIPASPGCP